MKKRALAFALALSSLPCPVALAQGPAPPPPAAPAPAPPKSNEADAHFRRGVELFKEADYATALIEFRRAYEIDPRYQVLYDVGETYDQLQDYANALRTFEKYQRDGGAQISAGRRDEVQKEIDKLRTRVASVEVTINLPDVEIAVDDVPVGKSPLAAPLVVSAGHRKVTATRAGKPPVTQLVDLAGGDVKKLTFTIVDDAGPPDGAREPPSAGRVPVAPWVVTGVLVAGAVVTGSLALVSSSALKTDLATVPGNADQISSDHSKTFAIALTTDVLIGAAVAAGVVSVVLTATSTKGAPAADKASARLSLHSLLTPPRTAQGSLPSVRLGAGPQSVVLSGTF